MRIELEDQPRLAKADSSSPDKTKPNTHLLSIKQIDGVYRARLVAGNMRSVDTDKLRAEIASLHSPGNPPMVMFSMREMDALASNCLGAFAQLGTDLEKIGGILVLYNIPKEIAKVLKKTKLDRVIQTAKARPQAQKRVMQAKKRFIQSLHKHAA